MKLTCLLVGYFALLATANPKPTGKPYFVRQVTVVKRQPPVTPRCDPGSTITLGTICVTSCGAGSTTSVGTCYTSCAPGSTTSAGTCYTSCAPGSTTSAGVCKTSCASGSATNTVGTCTKITTVTVSGCRVTNIGSVCALVSPNPYASPTGHCNCVPGTATTRECYCG